METAEPLTLAPVLARHQLSQAEALTVALLTPAPLSVFLQRSSEDRSVSGRTPEENPDQRSVDEAQHRRPVPD